MGLDLDLNSDLLQLETNDKFVRERERTRTRRTHASSCCPRVALTLSSTRAQTLALASTLALDGSRDSGTFDQSNAPSLLDQYDYGMYGKLYKWKQVRGLPKEPLFAFVAPCACACTELTRVRPVACCGCTRTNRRRPSSCTCPLAVC